MGTEIKRTILSAILGSICFLIFLLSCNIFENEKGYTIQDAIDNFNKNEEDFNKLVTYYHLNTRKDRMIFLGLGKKANHFDIGIGLPEGKIDNEFSSIGVSDLKLDSNKADSLLLVLGWNKQTVESLLDMLKKVNCVNITSGDPVRLDCKYNGIGVFSYLIFDEPLSDNEIFYFRKGKSTNPAIRNNVVITYSAPL